MTLDEIARALGLKLSGGETVEIGGVAPLADAGPGDIAFVQNVSAARNMAKSNAGALIIPAGVTADRPSLIADNPVLAMAKVCELLVPPAKAAPGVHPTAVVGAGVEMGEGVSVGPHVSVGDGARLGGRAVLRAGARVGARCVIGADSVIFENAVVYEGCVIGARCRIHANSTIGADGFGYVRLETGASYKIPQTGIVRIEDDVEIGANSSVDRATLGETVIKKGVKIDNQVQIGHNCVIGENTVIAGCSGVAGSTVIGDNVMIGGMVAVSDHVNIVSGAIIAGKTGVHGDIKKPGVYAGPMAMKNMEYKRFMLTGKVAEKLKQRIKAIEKKLGLTEVEER